MKERETKKNTRKDEKLNLKLRKQNIENQNKVLY
jgi:hypothetical protein